MSKKTIYIAGPMRGYPKFNFPAFDEAEDRLTKLGFNVLSPATMDRECGWNEDSPPFGGNDLSDCVRRDIDAIIKSDMVITLDGADKSIGATAEIAVAKWLNKPVKEFKDYAAI